MSVPTAAGAAAAVAASASASTSASSSSAAISLATRSTPARNACNRCVHFRRSAYRTTRVMNSVLALLVNVASNTAL